MQFIMESRWCFCSIGCVNHILPLSDSSKHLCKWNRVTSVHTGVQTGDNGSQSWSRRGSHTGFADARWQQISWTAMLRFLATRWTHEVGGCHYVVWFYGLACWVSGMALGVAINVSFWFLCNRPNFLELLQVRPVLKTKLLWIYKAGPFTGWSHSDNITVIALALGANNTVTNGSIQIVLDLDFGHRVYMFIRAVAWGCGACRGTRVLVWQVPCTVRSLSSRCFLVMILFHVSQSHQPLILRSDF